MHRRGRWVHRAAVCPGPGGGTSRVPVAAMCLCGTILLLWGVSAVPTARFAFRHHIIDAELPPGAYGQTAAVDIDGCGRPEFITGQQYGTIFWYKFHAPGRWTRHVLGESSPSDVGACVLDVDGDGRPDFVTGGAWYRNPGDIEEHWEEHILAPSAAGETPIFGDLLGDGRPVPVFAMNERFTWFRSQGDKNIEWHATAVTQQLPEFAQFGHGLGMGDVNGDGRLDLVGTAGWWEAPEDRGRRDWPFHKADLGPACANMLVYDVNGDGYNDIVTSSAHEYGIWWFEQRIEDGVAHFERHEIDATISQTHALVLADINSDGVHDFVTGKRYRAHNGHDPGADEPAVLCWIELQRPEPGTCSFTLREVDNNSGVGTQFEVVDLDNDGLLDIITSNKKGVHAFVQRRSN